jgi:hypothetical protein
MSAESPPLTADEKRAWRELGRAARKLRAAQKRAEAARRKAVAGGRRPPPEVANG